MNQLTKKKILTSLIVLGISFFILGPDILQGQVNGIVLAAFFVSALLLPNIYLKSLAVFVSAWLCLAYLISFVTPFPIADYVDASLKIFYCILAFLYVYNSKEDFDFWADIICVAALIQVVLGIYQFYFGDPMTIILSKFIPVSNSQQNACVGVLANTNFFGAYAAFSLMFFFRRKWWYFIPVVWWSILLAGSACATIAALIGCVWFLAGWYGVYAGLVVSVIYYTTISGVNRTGHSFVKVDRYDFWINAVEQIGRSYFTTLFGFGQGKIWQIGNQLHSEYFGTIYNFGLVGLSCMLAYIITVYKEHRLLFAVFIIVCINMLGNHPLHVPLTSLLIAVILALIEKARVRNLI